MPTIRLQHPITVLLRKADKAHTAVMDPLLREPVGQVRREQKPYRLQAQISITTVDNPTPSEGGVTLHSSGYLLFLTSDLREAGVVLERGDKVVQLGEGENGREVAYYLTAFEYMGHYPDSDGPQLLKTHFEDREPAQGGSR